MATTEEFTIKFGDNPIPGDQPILLGFEEYADLLISLIDKADLPTNLGIFGAWGTGKTTLMQKLQTKLQATGRFDTLWCDIWRYDDRTSMRKAVVRAVYAHVRQGQPLPAKIRHYIRKTPNVLASLFERISAKVKGPGVEFEFDLDRIFEEVDAMFRLDAIFSDRFEEAFSQLLNQHLADAENDSLVVFLDDLDRCSPSAIVSALEATKLYLNMPHVVFVVGCDAAGIARAVVRSYGEETGISGHDYLEKMFQMEFSIPSPSPEHIEEYVDACRPLLRDPSDIDLVYWPALTRALGYNPRRIKRLAVNHHILMTRSPHIAPHKAATAVALQIGFPNEFQHMVRCPEYLLDRQETALAISSGREKVDISEGLPPSDEALSRSRLLELLRVAVGIGAEYEDTSDVIDYLSYASSALAEGHHTALADLLFRQLQSDDEGARMRAITSLGRVGGSHAEIALMSILGATSESEEIRRTAGSALGRCGTASCMHSLEQVARDSALDKSLRSTCVAALGRVAGRSHQLTRSRGSEALVKIADGLEDGPSRYTAIMAIGRTRSPEAVSWLQRRVETASEREAAVIAKALGEAGGVGAAEALAELLYHPSNDVRQAAANAAAAVGEEAVAPLVTVLTNNDNASACAWATEALARIGMPAVDSIRDAVKSRMTKAPPRLITLLGALGGQDDIEDLTVIQRNSVGSDLELAVKRAIAHIRERTRQ